MHQSVNYEKDKENMPQLEYQCTQQTKHISCISTDRAIHTKIVADETTVGEQRQEKERAKDRENISKWKEETYWKRQKWLDRNGEMTENRKVEKGKRERVWKGKVYYIVGTSTFKPHRIV